MSDLQSNGCGCGYNDNRGGGSNFLCLILILLFCGCGNGNGIGNLGGCGGGNGCDWIIWIILLSCLCGGNSTNTCCNNGCGNNFSCF